MKKIMTLLLITFLQVAMAQDASRSIGDGANADQVYYPQGVALDGDKNIYVADSENNRIQKWAPGATEGVTVAGGNGYGSAAN